jgi:hypothetical protein
VRLVATAFTARTQNTRQLTTTSTHPIPVSRSFPTRPGVVSIRSFSASVGATVEEDLDAALDSILGETYAEESHIQGSHPMPTELVTEVCLPFNRRYPIVDGRETLFLIVSHT